MIDYGLVASMILAVGIPALLAPRWLVDRPHASSFVDEATGPLLAGLVVGRLTTLAIDDPNSLGSFSDMAVIRSGVEFWPGTVAAIGVVAWQARKDDQSPVGRLATIAPLVLVGHAAYEAACVFRDGCLGPVAPLGLRPPGLQSTMLPIGWLTAAVVLGAAIALQRIRSRLDGLVVVLTAIAVVATVRTIGSIWLPHVSVGPTRQHQTSMLVMVAAMLALAATIRTRGLTASPAESSTSGESTASSGPEPSGSCASTPTSSADLNHQQGRPRDREHEPCGE